MQRRGAEGDRSAGSRVVSHLPFLDRRDSTQNGNHVGARQDFPGTRANFAALLLPGSLGEVVAEPAPVKLSLAPAAHTASTAFAVASL